MFTEAPVSFNLKFYLEGFESQLTVRGTEVHQVLNRVPALIEILKGQGAKGRVTQPSSNGNGKGKGNGHQPTLCPSCKLEGMPVQGTSSKNGKDYHSLKCPKCQEFIPGTFRWV